MTKNSNKSNFTAYIKWARTAMFLSMLFLSLIACSQQDKVKVVLLAGQSNMAGSGNYDELSDSIQARIMEIAPRIMLSQKRKFEPLSYYLAPAKSKKYNFEKFFGPELFIGLSLADAYPESEILLIKTSMGGTALYGAWNPNWSAEKAQMVEKEGEKQKAKLFNEHITLVNENLDRLISEGKSYDIIGIAWMQGENDAAKEVSALSYEVNLKTLIQAYRDNFSLPELPFVFGQINSTYGRFKDGPRIVREGMAEVAKSTSNCIMLPTSTDRSWTDYPKHIDNTHYNTEGQKRLGIAFGEAIIQLK